MGVAVGHLLRAWRGRPDRLRRLAHARAAAPSRRCERRATATIPGRRRRAEPSARPSRRERARRTPAPARESAAPPLRRPATALQGRVERVSERRAAVVRGSTRARAVTWRRAYHCADDAQHPRPRRPPPSQTSPRGCARSATCRASRPRWSRILATKLGKPVLVEGPAGVGKTELAKALAALPGPRARAAAVLRGPGRGQGAVRVELPQAAAAHPGRGARAPAGTRSRRTSSARSSCSRGR